MFTTPVDYTKEQVADAVLILQQYLPHEKNQLVVDSLTKSLAVMRAIAKIGRGTKWLSELSGS
jgi:hypothetical protein